MNERAFRLDFFIAIGALLVSAFTAGTLVYQTRVIGDQFAATIWPYLTVGTTFAQNGETIEVANDGVGPALVRSARLEVDGKRLQAWNDYFDVLAHDPDMRKVFLRARAAAVTNPADRPIISMTSIGPSSTLRPGETETLMRLSLAGGVPPEVLAKHPVALEFCYCSLNGSCWILRGMAGRINADPQSVSHCSSADAIQSNPITPGARKRRP